MKTACRCSRWIPSYTLTIMKTKELSPAEIEERRADMMAAVGLWKDRTDLPDTEAYIRNLRGGDRLERLHAQWRREED